MKKIFAWIRGLAGVYCNEFRLMFHDAGLMLFVTFLPLAYPVIYSLIYNPEIVRDVATVIVDHDRTPMSREFVRKLDAAQGVWVKGYAADLHEAQRAMAGQDCFTIFEIPEGFQKRSGRGETAQAIMYCEMSLLLRYRACLVAATDVSQVMGAEIQTRDIDELGLGSLATSDPMPVNSVAMGNITSGFDSFIMPGVLMLILQQCIVLVLGMRGGARHENPKLIGYDPINHDASVVATMIGQMAAYFTIMFVPLMFLFHYVPLIFAFPMAGNPWEILAFMLPMVLASMCMGLCLQAFVWEREAVFVLWVVTSVIFLFLSGLTWPIYGMSPVWKAISAICPATWGVEGFIRMNSNGASLAQVGDCYRNLWILAGSYFVVAWVLHRFVIRPTEPRQARA